MLLSLVLFLSCGVLLACTSVHSKRTATTSGQRKEKQNNSDSTTKWLTAIVRPFVCMITRISFDEREKMNKVIGAINPTCPPWPVSLSVRPFGCNSLTRNSLFSVRKLHLQEGTSDKSVSFVLSFLHTLNNVSKNKVNRFFWTLTW